MRELKLFLVLLLLAGCGSSSKAKDLLVIGNSITQYGANPAIGWNGNWGMAAPSANEDFSHLVASAL
jgi:uncharacterized lipoprotein